jgi:hypothetical protein
MLSQDVESYDQCKRSERQTKSVGKRGHSRTLRSRNAFAITLTDESAIAAAAKIGESNRPNAG